ncbi:MAG: hypothetical protein C0592_07530, partial [Marinilabiliales bacterium]
YSAPVANFGVLPTLLVEDFESGALPTGWQILDEDGDTYFWEFDNSGTFTAHGGTGVAASASWDGAPLTPDNWLIAPAVDLSNTTPDYNLRYYVLGQDPAWEQEHYGVYVSTTGTAPGDFSLVFEETLPAGHTAYLERNIDLAAYKGNSTVYVAFRHFNCTDWYYLNLDDVSISTTVQPTQVSIYEGESVDFIDLSTNNPTMWAWDNPGGTPLASYTQNPTVEYYVAGYYDVTLTAANAAGSDDELKTNYVEVLGRAPIADFYGTGNLKDLYLRPFIPVGGTVDYTDYSIQVPTAWSWSFPGGTPSTYSGQTPPSITYNSPGLYSPSLTATNAHGSDAVTGTDFVVVGGTDTCTNMIFSDGLAVYGFTNGLIPGHGDDGSGNYLLEYAEFYSNSYPGKISGIEFGCYSAQGTGKTVTWYIAEDGGGQPGTILWDSIIPITTFTEAAWNFITIPDSVAVTGNFFIGYQLNYDAGHDYNTHQFCTYMTAFRSESVASTGYFMFGPSSPGTWYTFEAGFGDAASVLLHPEFTYDQSGPIITATATPGCGSGDVTITSNETANQTFYLVTGLGAPVANWTGNTNTHTFTGLSDGDYKGYTDNGGTISGFSNIVTLTNDPTTVGGTLTPTNTEICFGENTGVITLSGETGTVNKWQKRVDGGAWTDIVSTASTYSEIPSSAGYWEYRAEVQSGACPAAFSSIVGITVHPTTVPGTVSSAVTEVCLGDPTGLLTLTGYTGSVVRWQKSNNGGVSWTDIANTADTYSETPASAGTWLYRAVVQSGTCSEDFSASHSVTVYPVSVGGTLSGTFTQICVGDPTGTMTLTGYTGTINKWQVSTDGGSTWTDIANTTATYSETPVGAGTYDYRVEVQSGSCPPSYSNNYNIVVNPTSVGGTVTGTNTEICLGDVTGTMTLSGYVGNIVKWQRSNDGGTTWTDIANTTTTHSETPGVAGTWDYRAVIQSGVCPAVNSTSFSITVYPASVGGTVSGPSTEICLGDPTGTMTLAGHTGTVLRWQVSTDGGTIWTDIANTTTTHSETPAAAGTYMYRAEVQSGTCGAAFSAAHTITVYPVTVPGAVTAAATEICL